MEPTEGASWSSEGGIGMGAGGAKSHAYIQYPPLRCDIPGAAGVMYDDGNKLLLVPVPSKIYSWPTNQYPPAEAPVAINIKEGPVLGAKYSLDGELLAIQRSKQEMEFVTTLDSNNNVGVARIEFWVSFGLTALATT